MVPPPQPSDPAPLKRKCTGRTKSTATTTKRHKSAVLEAQEKAELEAALAKSLRVEQEKLAKEKADAEALEAALRKSKEEATIHVDSEDTDDSIQKILKIPIVEEFLHSSAPSTSSVHPSQMHASKDYTIESVSDEDSIDSLSSPPHAPSPPPSAGEPVSSPPPSTGALVPSTGE